MSIYLSHTSLRKSWALIGRKGLVDSTACDVRRPLDAARTLREIREKGYFCSGFLSRLPEPIDLLVPAKDARIYSKRINPHLCLRELPAGSFRQIRDDVFLLTPAMNYVQMGEVLTLGQLAAYGTELCGEYTLAPGTERGFIDRPHLCRKEELADASKLGPRVRGSKRARLALCWVVEGSRSPRETIMVVVLCLPENEGGYGLPLSELNPAIVLSDRAARIAGRHVLHPDLCWPHAKTIVEYDSDGCHLDESQVIRDVDRKDAFAEDGWHVITITNDRLWKAEVLDEIVRERLAPLLGVELSPATMSFLEKRKELRRGLFDFDPYRPTRGICRGIVR